MKLVDINIHRGTQDMKSVCIQYIEAMGRLKEKNKLLRTVHLTYVPGLELVRIH